MNNYKTIKEMAIKWNSSERYIQYLCREEKIEGVIKTSRSWLIPDNAPNPLKNTKSGSFELSFTGTKAKIFDASISLFMQKGYENIGVRDIANKVGLRPSALYNHFKSKQHILDTIYDYFKYYLLYDRPTNEELMPLLKDYNKLEVIKCVSYDFSEEHKDRLMDVIKIMLQRSFTDKTAKKMVKSLMLDEGIKYAEGVYNTAVEMGRLPPIDTHALAVFVNSIRLYILQNWIVDQSLENLIKVTQEEQMLYSYAAYLIK